MLRKATENDRGTLREWRNANAQYFPPAPKLTVDRHLEWWEKYVNNPWDHMYMVTTTERRPVGTVSIDLRSRMINRVMRGDPEGPGLMTQALFDLMGAYGEGQYALQVMEGNGRAVRFYEDHLGFRRCGRQRYDFADPKSPLMINMTREYCT